MIAGKSRPERIARNSILNLIATAGCMASQCLVGCVIEKKAGAE
jgi:hypothetical protein